MHSYSECPFSILCSSYTDDQLTLATRLYFLHELELTTSPIGRIVNVSQAKVSRMLSPARERGLVRVTIPTYDPRSQELEYALKAAPGIGVESIRNVARLQGAAHRPMIGHFAAAERRCH